MDLLRGNPDDLEGKVVVFSAFKDKNSAQLACYNINDLLAVIKQGPETRTKLEEQTRDQAEQMIITDRGAMRTYVNFYSVNFILGDERWLDKMGVDAIDAGECKNEEERKKAIREKVIEYMFEFDEQEKWVQREEKKLKHSDFAPDKIAGYVKHTYVERMNYALAEKNTRRACDIQREFRRFSRGSRFEKFVPELCSYVYDAGSGVDWKVVDLHVKRIHALSTEKYEDANFYKSQLAAVKQKTL